jgi:hypothetical protein
MKATVKRSTRDRSSNNARYDEVGLFNKDGDEVRFEVIG